MSTHSEWKARQEQYKLLAAEKKQTYPEQGAWNAHNKECSDCNVTTKPYSLCEKSLEIYRARPKSDWTDLPQATCPNCGKEWTEEDYSGISSGDKLTCTNCAMIHEVTGVDWSVSVELTCTGEFDPSTLGDIIECAEEGAELEISDRDDQLDNKREDA